MTGEAPKSTRRDEWRVSHAEREAVADRLSKAAADGRIDLTELDARLELALTAKTYGDLTSLTADLPPEESAEPRQPMVVKGGLNGMTRAGRWQVPARISVYGGIGSAKLDLTQAECRLPEVEIEVHGQMGGVTIVIPDGWVAETGGVDPGLGGFADRTTADRLPGTPLIRLNGSGGVAGVVIRHPNVWERRRLKRELRREQSR